MVKNKKCLRAVLFGLVILAAILFIRVAYAQEKPEPKLLWQRSFEERVDGPVYVSKDGDIILVNASTKRYIVNGKDGKIVKSFEERRPSAGWVLSGDGKRILDDYGRIMDVKGKVIGRVDWQVKKITYIGLPEKEPLKKEVHNPFPYFHLSPGRKFAILLESALEEPVYVSLDVCNFETGELLWSYSAQSVEDANLLAVAFVDDSALVMCIYDTIAPILKLVDLQTGKEMWEKRLTGWQLGSGFPRICVEHRRISIIDGSYENMVLLNLTGEILWQGNIRNISSWTEGVSPYVSRATISFFSDDERYLFTLVGKTPLTRRLKKSTIYLKEAKSGDVVWEWSIPEPVFYVVSPKRNFLFAISEHKIYTFGISLKKEEGKK